MNSVESDVRMFLGKFISTQSLASDANLFETGFMTSLFAAQLITFVEKHFGVGIPDEDLEMRNFVSIDAIATLVERLRVSSNGVA